MNIGQSNNGAELLIVLVEEDSGIIKEGRNWYRSEKHSSLVVNSDSGKWYWNSENMGGTILDYLILVRGYDKKNALKVLDTRGKILNGSLFDEENPTPLGKPYEKLVDILWQLGKGNRDYWYARKLTDKTIDRYRLGFYDGWYLIPLYIGDMFVNFQKRRDIPEKKIRLWYRLEKWMPVMINPEILQIVDTVFLTEGPVDAMLLNQEGIPAVSHTGGAGYWGADWFHYFNRVKKIYYVADNDEAGKAAAIRAAKALGVDRTFIYEFEGKEEKYDTGDYFKEGGNAKEFRELVETNAKNIYEIGELNVRKRRSSFALAGTHKRYK